MDWTEISVTVKTGETELAASICNMVSGNGIFIEDYSDLEQESWNITHVDLIDEELIAKNRNQSVIHIYLSDEQLPEEAVQFIEERLSASNVEHKTGLSCVKESDWAENWKQYFKITPVGERIVICPSWEHYSCTAGKVVLKIDPGAAFGTGTHSTTVLCLELIQKYLEHGDSVLDIGCGSGILSIATVLLGAGFANGVDIDETAVKVAKKNARINRVENKTNYINGDLDKKIKGRYDIICANIVADVIMRLNMTVKNYMDNSSVYIASGIINVRADQVRQNFKDSGFIILEELKKQKWFAFALKKC